VQEEEDNLIENDIQIFCLEEMELELDIEKIFSAIEQPENMAQQILYWNSLQMRLLVKRNPSLFKVLFFIRSLKS
jgi:hypothetical protein